MKRCAMSGCHPRRKSAAVAIAALVFLTGCGGPDHHTLEAETYHRAARDLAPALRYATDETLDAYARIICESLEQGGVDQAHADQESVGVPPDQAASMTVLAAARACPDLAAELDLGQP